jgi:iron complex outermembrane receptor protein
LPADFVDFGPFIPVFPTGGVPIGTGAFGPWFTPGGDLDPLERNVSLNEESAWALFTGMDYDITDALTARFELRYTDSTKESTLTFWDEEDLNNPTPLSVQNGKVDFQQWTGRLGLDFNMNDNWMVYGYVARGEKPGGITFFSAEVVDIDVSPDPIPVEGVVPFDPEKITTYEIGAKGRTSDGRVGLNLALYYNDWKDIVLRQTVEFDPISGLPLDQPEAVNVNAADAGYFGFEIDTDIMFTENFTGRFSLAFADAEINNARQDTYERFPSFAPTGDVSGNQLLRRAKWQATAGLGYSRVITGDWEFYTRGDWSWQDDVFIGNDNQSYIPARSIVNGSIGVKSGRYTIEIWARNLLDDDTPISAYRDVFFTNTDDFQQENPPQSTTSDFFPIRYSVSHPRLRTFGLTARVRFGGDVR